MGGRMRYVQLGVILPRQNAGLGCRCSRYDQTNGVSTMQNKKVLSLILAAAIGASFTVTAQAQTVKEKAKERMMERRSDVQEACTDTPEKCAEAKAAAQEKAQMAKDNAQSYCAENPEKCAAGADAAKAKAEMARDKGADFCAQNPESCAEGRAMAATKADEVKSTAKATCAEDPSLCEEKKKSFWNRWFGD